METSNRSRLLAMAFILCVTVLLRYPIYPHEFGGDTLELHWHVDELREQGTQGFAMSPLSWFGLYPVSYAQGVPIMGAMLGDLAGIPSDLALAICGIVIGIIGVFGFFVVAYKLTNDFTISLICAASLATSGFGVPQTIWGLSGRAAVQSLFPFGLWALLPAAQRGPAPVMKHLSLRLLVLVLVNFAMAAFHRLFLLAALTLLLTVFVLVFHARLLMALPPNRVHFGKVPFPALLVAAAFLTYGALNLPVGVRSGPSFLREFFVTSDQRLFVLGYILEFAYNTGPFIVLLVVGLVAAARGSTRWSISLSALVVVLGIEFFLVVPSFSSVTLAPIVGVLLGVGGQRAVRALRHGTGFSRRGAGSLLVGILMGALAFQGYFVSETQEAHRNPDGTSFYLDQESIESGVFLRWDTSNTTFITPDLTDSRRVAAAGHIATVSSEPMLFSADPSLRSDVRIEYGFAGRDDPLDPSFYVDVATSLIVSKTLFQAYDWIVPGSGYGQGNHWGQAVTLDSSADRILDAYHVDHVLLNNYRSSSRMTTLTRANYYVEYANSLESVYLIQHDGDCIYGQRGCP